MDLLAAIEKRRSVRDFDPGRPVDEKAVEAILSAGIKAPSAGNGQDWHFVVVRDQKLKHRLAFESGHQKFIEQVPVVIVVCADLERAAMGYGTRGRDTYSLQDTAAAVENMLLVIVSMGLGACWVGAFDEAAASRILDLPKNLRPVAMLPVGVPAEVRARPTPRRPVGEVATYK